MSRRRRQKTRTRTVAKDQVVAVAVGGQELLPRKSRDLEDHGARVTCDPETWEAFKQTIPPGESVGRILGDYVTRHVNRAQARQAKDGQLDDAGLLDALKRAQELQSDLSSLVARIEQRIDHPFPQRAASVLSGRWETPS